MQSAIELRGNAIAKSIKEEITTQVNKLKEANIYPKLAVVSCSSDPAVLRYVQSKKKTASSLGIEVVHSELSPDVSQETLNETLQMLADDQSVHGIILEFPLPSHIDSEQAVLRMKPCKDVDGLHPYNMGLLALGKEDSAILPATPQACIQLLETYCPIKGKKVAIVGRGRTVGRPLASMLVNRGATVTICHTQTASLKDALKDCEIVVAATGKPKLLDGNILQPGQVVIDAGIAELDGKLCGDLDVTSTATILQAYTPVPGGVGPVTTAFILKNLIRAIEIQQQPSPDSLWETPLQKFIAQTASDRPTPGGGSVACVSASMGFGLLLMALRISSKRKDIDESNNIFALSSKLEAMLESAKNSAIEDIECFNEYMSALSLPKSTDEEKNARKKALADATNKAIEVPLNACANILEGLHLAKDAAMFSNRFVVSDVGAGSSLLYGAIEANLWNILINAQSLSEDRKAEFLEKIASTRRQAQELFEQVKELVASKIEQK